MCVFFIEELLLAWLKCFIFFFEASKVLDCLVQLMTLFTLLESKFVEKRIWIGYFWSLDHANELFFWFELKNRFQRVERDSSSHNFPFLFHSSSHFSICCILCNSNWIMSAKHDLFMFLNLVAACCSASPLSWWWWSSSSSLFSSWQTSGCPNRVFAFTIYFNADRWPVPPTIYRIVYKFLLNETKEVQPKKTRSRRRSLDNESFGRNISKNERKMNLCAWWQSSSIHP